MPNILTTRSKRYFEKQYFLVGKTPFELLSIVCLFLIVALLDVAGIGIISPLITSMSNPIIIKELIFELIGVVIPEDMVLIYISIATIILFILKSLVSFLSQRFILKFSFGVRADLIYRLSSQYVNLPIAYHQNNNVASIIQTIQGHTHIYIDRSLLPVMRAISESIVLLVIVSYLFYIAPYIMISAIFLLSSIVFLYNYLLRSLYFEKGKKEIRSSEGIIQNIKEVITGIREIKILKVQDFFLNRIKSNANDQAMASMETHSYTILPRYVLESTLIIFVVSVELTYFLRGADMSQILPILGVFAVASFRLIPSINQISVALSQTSISLSAVNDIHEDLSKPSIDSYSKFNIIKDQNELLLLDNISYKVRSNIIFEKANLEINKGDCIGIIGESGSGKTTLLNIISGLLQINHGEISCNLDFYKENDSLKSNVSIVDQSPLIINDSLRRNIALGIDDQNINDEKVLEAIKYADLDSFMISCGTLDYVISDDGSNISGGQKQRIAIARSIYSNREIMILDEPSSALDKKTEQNIFNLIYSLNKLKTIIIVSHKMDLLNSCNKIYEVKNHKINKINKFNK